ncbi:MAG: dTDP-glucose 4,6-dehydratase [Nanoarchaeota archaeon]|nr:dTDP-glucose 4,6-dehydratase [Nanoarchaeota archaeon]
MKKILVTGGCGFIGSNFIKYLLTDQEVTEELKVVNLDKQTYAGQGKNIEHLGLYKHERYKFVKGDICDRNFVGEVFSKEKPALVFHFAAESHVDRSIADSNPFERTNVFGTEVLLEVAKDKGIEKFVYVSTDEVYGSAKQGSFAETDSLNSSNPYAETKVKAEERVIGMKKAFPAVITRSANNYGSYQYPEKLLPLFITNLIEGKKVPLMWSEENPGLNVRDWLHVEDNCKAIWFVAQKGREGEIYNIPGENERTNIEMTRMLLSYFGYTEDMIQKVPHRTAHDFRYSINGEKLKLLGFEYNHQKDLKQEISQLCGWYKRNQDWWRPLKK